jgi:tetratricopeptide (TPR) repeat protein
MAAGPQPAIVIPDETLDQLIDDLATRRIRAGLERLRTFVGMIGELCPEIPNAAQLLTLFTMWADVDPSCLPDLNQAIETHFPVSTDSQMKFCDTIAVRLARGLINMHEQRPESAISYLEPVYGVKDAIRYPDQAIVAAYCLSRCKRDAGQYEEAKSWVEEALRLSRALPDRAKQQAVISLMQAWLLQQTSEKSEEQARQDVEVAREILKNAERELLDTDDHITIGNLHAMIARRWRRLGNYKDASEVYEEKVLPRFQRAHEEYGISHPNHRRALANAGFCARLVALREDKNLRSRRMTRTKEAFLYEVKCDLDLTHSHPELQRLIERKLQAWAPGTEKDLTSAEEDIKRNRNRAERRLIEAKNMEVPGRGLGMSSIYLAYLYIDMKNKKNNLDLARDQAQDAQRVAGSDNLLLGARASAVQCVIENCLAEKSTSEVDRLAYLTTAERHARHAVKGARAANHPGVIAKSLTWLGITLARKGFHEPTARSEAFALCQEAGMILEKAKRGDYIWEDFMTLKHELFKAEAGKAEIHDWLLGMRKLTLEDLENYVVTIVWKRRAQDARQAQEELQVTREKFHRILSRAGHHIPKTRRNPKNSGGVGK